MCAMATRRAQLRTSLERDLKATALGHLRDHGAGELSLRAVARDVGLSPAGVYRYFASREELLTALISDGYDDLADHLVAALDAEGQTAPRARMAAAARAYRAWALEHPHEFALLYGTPIPGYAAPEGGTTVAANRRVGQQLLTPLVEAFAAGTLRIPDPYTADLQMGPALGDDIAVLAGRDVPDSLGAVAMAAWARLHGIVTLEVLGHLHWIYPTGAEPLFEAALAEQLDDLFLP